LRQHEESAIRFAVRELFYAQKTDMAKMKAGVLKLLLAKVSMTWNRVNDWDGRPCDR